MTLLIDRLEIDDRSREPSYVQLAGHSCAGGSATAGIRRVSCCHPSPSWPARPGWASRRCAGPSRSWPMRAGSSWCPAAGRMPLRSCRG